MSPKVNPHEFIAHTPAGDPVLFNSDVGRIRDDGSVQQGMAVNQPQRAAFINSRARGKLQLDNFTHEAIHEVLPKMKEQQVKRLSDFLTDVLWKAGYRRITEKKHARPVPGRRSGRSRNA